MIAAPAAVNGQSPHVSVWHSLTVLMKFRVNFMVAMTAAGGAYLAAVHGPTKFISFTTTAMVIGVTLAACGTAAINQLMEREVDARMKRTCMRPLITGALTRSQAIVAAGASLVGGLLLLAFTIDTVTAALTLFTTVVYLLAYTPLKLVTPVCTSIGAIAGAMPPLIGYRALAGHIDAEAVVLFLILFAWQFPHFHCIAAIYREDYAAAGVKMLAVVDENGRRIRRSVVAWSAVLVLVSLAPYVMGFAGPVYAASALLLGGWFLTVALRFTGRKTSARVAPGEQARKLMHATLVYLPLLILVMVANAR